MSSNTNIIKVIVVDDDESIIETIKNFSSSQYSIKIQDYSSPLKALSWSSTHHFDIALIDYRMPEMDGLTLAKKLREIKPDSCYLMMTGYPDLEITIKAIRTGIFDFLCKPLAKQEFDLAIERAIEHLKLKEQNSFLRSLVQIDHGEGQLIGKSEKIISIRNEIKLLAQSEAPVLITGETGVGKEIVAQMIHTTGNRHKSPFVPVNCSSFAETLLESELFGHEKGSFTGAHLQRKGRLELARKGTVFLDELCEIPMQMQVKLLRVLQEKEFERVGGSAVIKLQARIISATNRKIKEDIKNNRFRSDFYYRINTHHIHIPPLRERKKDIEFLAIYFLRKFSVIYNKQVSLLNGKVIDFFHNHPWPGNVRQLENVINATVLCCNKDIANMEHLPEDFLEESIPRQSSDRVKEESGAYEREYTIPSTILADPEGERIIAALEINKWNKTKTALFLGFTRSQLLYRLKKYKIV